MANGWATRKKRRLTWRWNGILVVIGKQDHVDFTPFVLIRHISLHLLATPEPLLLVLCKPLDECLVIADIARRVLLQMGPEVVVTLEHLPTPRALDGKGMTPVKVCSAEYLSA